MRCIKGTKFVQQTRSPNQLGAYLHQAILDIKQFLFRNIRFVNPSRPYRIDVGGGIAIPIPASTRIYEVPKSIWPHAFPRWRHARGLHRSSFGKILLHQDNWCRKTLIHEALHALSVFNIRTDLRRYLFLREGITEFFTGYILFRKYSGCYQAWSHETYPECKVTYKRQARLWCAFCNFVSIKETVKIYFWDPTISWRQCYNQFLDAIHNAGYPNFRDIFSLDPTPTLEEVFKQECIDNFGREFLDVLESRRRSLDCSKILP